MQIMTLMVPHMAEVYTISCTKASVQWVSTHTWSICTEWYDVHMALWTPPGSDSSPLSQSDSRLLPLSPEPVTAPQQHTTAPISTRHGFDTGLRGAGKRGACTVQHSQKCLAVAGWGFELLQHVRLQLFSNFPNITQWADGMCATAHLNREDRKSYLFMPALPPLDLRALQ